MIISGGISMGGFIQMGDTPVPIPFVYDNQFNYVTALFYGNSATSTFIADASTNNFALTIAGDTKPNNFNPYTPGYYSNYFDGGAGGSGDYIGKAGSGVLPTSSEDVTIECWIFPLSTSVNGLFDGGSLETGILRNNPANKIEKQGSAATAATFTVTANQWQHFACTFTAGLIKVYINGMLNGSGSYTGGYSGGSSFNIGSINSGANSGADGSFNGYISNFRVTKSILYTTTFTPSTAPLTAIANTSLLTCQSNRFLDNSSNAFAVTVAGNTTINPRTPFVPNTQYAAYGSTYFDGTTDYLQITNNTAHDFGSGDFSVEVWVYPTGDVAYSNVISKDNGNGAGWLFEYSATRGLFVAWASTNISSAGAYVKNSWSHLVFCRSGTTVSIYRNGARLATATSSASISSANNLRIGAVSGATLYEFPGYISNVRIVKGSSAYNATLTTITVPTAPLTAVTGTSLLTLQTNQPVNNSVFLDNSTNAFLVTRTGNTTQGTFSPYGANWSNYFAGTGANYLFLSGPQNFYDGKPLTVEGWFYAQSSADVQFAGNYENSGSGWTVQTYQQKIVVNLSGDAYDIVGTTTYALNTWHHFALSGTAGSWKLFLNGLQEGSTYTGSVTLNSSAGLTIGGLRWSGANYSQLNGYISNLRIDQSNIYTSNFTPSTAPLPPTNTTYILTCNSNRLADTGPKDVQGILPFTGGTVSVQRFSPFSPQTQTAITHSAYFDGSGDYLTVPTTALASLDVATGADCTYEFWIYPTALQDGGTGFYHSGTIFSRGEVYCAAQVRANGTFHHYMYNGTAYFTTTSAGAIAINIWTHVAVVLTNNTVTIYINGISAGTGTRYTLSLAGQAVKIGVSDTTIASSFWRGYISNFAVYNVAKYTSTFTPSTTPLTATQLANTNGNPSAAITGTQTSLLTLQSPTFVDNSSNNFALTAFDNVKPRTVNPFGFTSATAAYSAATYGGSTYLNGNGDYLQTPSSSIFNLNAGDWTIEGWFYLTVAPVANQRLFVIDGSSTYGMYTKADGGIYYGLFGSSEVAIAPAGTLSGYNQWKHIAFVKSGASTTTCYVNGVLAGSTTSYSLPNSNCTFYIAGSTPYAANIYAGYISDFRVVRGTAVYASAFTPTTTPLRAVVNTQLLLNFTSAAISDSSGMNNAVTVGSAQASTTQFKYGTASMKFNGTTDYLTIPYNPGLIFGTGDFTIECWLYQVAFVSDMVITASYATWATSVNFYFGTRAGSPNILIFRAGDSIPITLNGNTAILANSWTHLAVSRASGVTRMFVDGVAQSATHTGSINIGATANSTGIGAANNASEPINGYINDLRITKGYARYSSAFPPPTAQLPNS